MKASTPWELPVEVIHPDTKHVVGRVYRDGLFIAFERSGSPFYTLSDEGTFMRTIHDLHLRLTSEFPSHALTVLGARLNKAIFDECLYGETAWSREEPRFVQMRLPCANILTYMSVSPIMNKINEDGSMTATARDFKRFEFSLPKIQAKGCVEFTCDWSSKTFVQQRFTSQAALMLEYEVPTLLSTIKEHEERLRSFFDFIWFRGHRSGMLYLHNDDRMTMLYRRESISPEVRGAHCLDLRGILTQQNLAEWIERWFSLPEAVRMAMEPVVSIARNPGIITDMKMVMVMHALDALVKTTKHKGKAIEARLLHSVGKWWGLRRDPNSEGLSKYIHRVIATRNLVLKVSQHEAQVKNPLLSFNERPRAYFELLLLHRAMFLNRMDIEEDRINAFVEAGFGKINAQEFRYFKD